ncbi:putative 2-hydroxyhepta-2,4-diene-1,7-dioate isomerase precursor [Azorhizobium caulinodans ORS 571]|uniref:Putative 2-hydroxyhepta-2,4-diene-1,7-dioate isomerase n=1 Tax=Azorhizobium caulinodans (strain ATCC 43989 / DSM 5975 / JCM 20966 / LMG 6465 / NBRC 14845 / NCIMB 13405 / ORS 571) TaxID=438753 RepID=A8IM26_AZOC5|nr:fumarylacetoacetate hydrolase family protein [Azorhizobium caulinodans]BAF86470.1 putative 2-hydroxyhepta-2,4-diene-1,7-dioate isomerase precursor [Azorhizobium caulinodans ORS 571]
MAKWVRFTDGAATGFGRVEGDQIAVHSGDMFGAAQPTGETRPLAGAQLAAPCDPTKIIALWNNFHGLAAKLNVAEPAEPLYLLKSTTTVAAPDAEVRRPPAYSGKTVYEGELGIVIGRTARNISEDEAAEHIFGYTIVNDLTAADILNKDPTFPQWARAKGFDGYGPFGPWIVTDLDPATASVRTVLNGAERQNYPLSDMIFPPAKLVALLSQDMTLNPGDLIACGTSIGVGSMKEPRNEVDVSIDGIGTLRTIFVQ